MVDLIVKKDEVINLEDTISGVVYKIEGDMIFFIDEYDIKYRMNKNYLRIRQKMDKHEKYLFTEERKNLFK